MSSTAGTQVVVSSFNSY